MSTRGDDDVGHTDGAEGFGKVGGEAGFHTHEVAEAEIDFGRRNELADEVDKPMFELSKNITGVGSSDGEKFGAGHFANEIAKTGAEFPLQGDEIGAFEIITARQSGVKKARNGWDISGDFLFGGEKAEILQTDGGSPLAIIRIFGECAGDDDGLILVRSENSLAGKVLADA